MPWYAVSSLVLSLRLTLEGFIKTDMTKNMGATLLPEDVAGDIVYWAFIDEDGTNWDSSVLDVDKRVLDN